MSERNRTSSSASTPESSSQPPEWPEGRFVLLYLAVALNTALTIFLLWLFSNSFS